MSEKKDRKGDDMPEMTDEAAARTIPFKVLMRLRKGELAPGADVTHLRTFLARTQEQFSMATGISVHTLRGWEQGRRTPDGPGLALIRIAARHPDIIREELRAKQKPAA